MKDALQHIQQDWDFMTKDDCVPVQVALQLMDTSTLGRADRYDDFQLTHQKLQTALKAIVNGKSLVQTPIALANISRASSGI